MPRFDLILPEGRLLLRNPETGETLAISAESGPVRLGSVELALSLSLAGAAAAPLKSADDAEASPAPAPASAVPQAAQESGGARGEPRAAPDPNDALEAFALDPLAFERRLAVREGYSPEPVEAVDPAAIEHPAAPDGAAGAASPSSAGADRPRGRVFEAPFDALTAEDFERTLEAISSDRDNLSREIEFLEEIEGDQQDIADLQDADRSLERAYALAVKRFDEWKAREKRRDEE